MDQAYLHLLINHIPILGSIFGLCLLLAGFIYKSDHLLHAAMVVAVISALFGIGAYLTGEEAEHKLEGRIGINESAIEEHEESAEISMWISIVAGAISLGTLAAFKASSSYSKPLLIICIIFQSATIVSMVHTGKEGGMIRHTELLQSDSARSDTDDD